MGEHWLTAEGLIADWIGDDQPYGMEETIGRWIGRAERLLRREFPTLPQRLANPDREPDLQDTVKDVLSAMVTRVIRNPEGIRQRQETDGSFTGSITYSGDMPGELYLTDSERDSLREPDKPRIGQAFNISMMPARWADHVPWCDLYMGGDTCSCGAVLAGHPIYEGG